MTKHVPLISLRILYIDESWTIIDMQSLNISYNSRTNLHNFTIFDQNRHNCQQNLLLCYNWKTYIWINHVFLQISLHWMLDVAWGWNDMILQYETNKPSNMIIGNIIFMTSFNTITLDKLCTNLHKLTLKLVWNSRINPQEITIVISFLLDSSGTIYIDISMTLTDKLSLNVSSNPNMNPHDQLCYHNRGKC